MEPITLSELLKAVDGTLLGDFRDETAIIERVDTDSRNIHPGALFKGLKPLIFIVALTGLSNLFYTEGRILVEFWIFRITAEGITRAILMVLRILLLV